MGVEGDGRRENRRTIRHARELFKRQHQPQIRQVSVGVDLLGIEQERLPFDVGPFLPSDDPARRDVERHFHLGNSGAGVKKGVEVLVEMHDLVGVDAVDEAVLACHVPGQPFLQLVVPHARDDAERDAGCLDRLVDARVGFLRVAAGGVEEPRHPPIPAIDDDELVDKRLHRPQRRFEDVPIVVDAEIGAEFRIAGAEPSVVEPRPRLPGWPGCIGACARRGLRFGPADMCMGIVREAFEHDPPALQRAVPVLPLHRAARPGDRHPLVFRKPFDRLAKEPIGFIGVAALTQRLREPGIGRWMIRKPRRQLLPASQCRCPIVPARRDGGMMRRKPHIVREALQRIGKDRLGLIESAGIPQHLALAGIAERMARKTSLYVVPTAQRLAPIAPPHRDRGMIGRRPQIEREFLHRLRQHRFGLAQPAQFSQCRGLSGKGGGVSVSRKFRDDRRPQPGRPFPFLRVHRLPSIGGARLEYGARRLVAIGGNRGSRPRCQMRFCRQRVGGPLVDEHDIGPGEDRHRARRLVGVAKQAIAKVVEDRFEGGDRHVQLVPRNEAGLDLHEIDALLRQHAGETEEHLEVVPLGVDHVERERVYAAEGGRERYVAHRVS